MFVKKDEGHLDRFNLLLCYLAASLLLRFQQEIISFFFIHMLSEVVLKVLSSTSKLSEDMPLQGQKWKKKRTCLSCFFLSDPQWGL